MTWVRTAFLVTILAGALAFGGLQGRRQFGHFGAHEAGAPSIVLRSVDPLTGEVKSLAGTGKAGLGTTDKIGFFEPHGVAALGDALYVADTNQHRVVVVEGGKARVLVIELPKP